MSTWRTRARYWWLLDVNLDGRRDRLYHWLARRVPWRLRYWCVIVGAVKAAGNDLNPGEVTSLQMLKSLDPDSYPHPKVVE